MLHYTYTLGKIFMFCDINLCFHLSNITKHDVARGRNPPPVFSPGIFHLYIYCRKMQEELVEIYETILGGMWLWAVLWVGFVLYIILSITLINYSKRGNKND